MLFRFQVARWTRKILLESGAFTRAEAEAIWSNEANALWVRDTKDSPGMNYVLNSAVVAALNTVSDLHEAGAVTREQLTGVFLVTQEYYTKYVIQGAVAAALDGSASTGWGEATGEARKRVTEILSVPPDLYALYRDLGAGLEGKIAEGGLDAVRDGIDRLVKRCIADPELRKLLGSHKVDGDGIKKLYDTLLVSGAGQWAGRRWVPADALLTHTTLAELLDRWSDAHTDWTEVSWQLLRRYGVS